MLRTYCYDDKPTHIGCKTISLCNFSFAFFRCAHRNEDIFRPPRRFMGKSLFPLIIPRAIFRGNYRWRREDLKLKIKSDILYANERDLLQSKMWARGEKFRINCQHNIRQSNFHANVKLRCREKPFESIYYMQSTLIGAMETLVWFSSLSSFASLFGENHESGPNNICMLLTISEKEAKKEFYEIF